MTPDEALEEMENILEQYQWDAESRHIKADELLCKILEHHGHKELVRQFREMEKWYA